MSESHLHATHPDLVKRLKRAEGHLRHVIEMIEAGTPCADVAASVAGGREGAVSGKADPDPRPHRPLPGTWRRSRSCRTAGTGETPLRHHACNSRQPDLPPSLRRSGHRADRDRPCHRGARASGLADWRARMPGWCSARRWRSRWWPMSTLAPIASAFADRVPRRAMLVALDLIRATVAVALPFVDRGLAGLRPDLPAAGRFGRVHADLSGDDPRRAAGRGGVYPRAVAVAAGLRPREPAVAHACRGAADGGQLSGPVRRNRDRLSRLGGFGGDGDTAGAQARTSRAGSGTGRRGASASTWRRRACAGCWR